jgi:uncharacterized protein (DUF952 family)
MGTASDTSAAPMGPLLHLTDEAAWAAARASGRIAPPGLATEGFVHCSTPDQIERVANAFYAGRTDLVLLTLDPALLGSPLVWEGPIDPRTGRPETEGPAAGLLFPHVYGPIATEAVITDRPWHPDADGRFRLDA